MPVINGKTLLRKAPILLMKHVKVQEHGVSYGLGEAGYDIRIKQEIKFRPLTLGPQIEVDGEIEFGRFCIASAMEEFQMPDNLVGIVHDKSTWARFGLSVFNTVIEPGWHGFLTLELVYHGDNNLFIPAGSGIAQVVFHETTCAARYDGKYQRQSQGPTGPILTK